MAGRINAKVMLVTDGEDTRAQTVHSRKSATSVERKMAQTSGGLRQRLLQAGNTKSSCTTASWVEADIVGKDDATNPAEAASWLIRCRHGLSGARA